MPTATPAALPAAAPVATKPRPLATYRVVIRSTGAALRRRSNEQTFVDRPAFGRVDHYLDQLAEFPSHGIASLVAAHVEIKSDMAGKFADGDLAVEAVQHHVSNGQENAVLCKVRDTMELVGWMELRHLLTPERRGLVGLPR